MNTATIKKVIELLSPPIYVFKTHSGGYTVDKLTLNEKKTAFQRHQYLITGRSQCTCMSWLKVGQCKHLQMLSGQLDWIGSGVIGELAAEETRRIAEGLIEALGAKDKSYTSEDISEDRIQIMRFNIPKLNDANFVQIIALNKYPSGNLAIQITADTK